MTPPHGTLSRYTNQECRCDECRRANTERAFRRRRERAAAIPNDKHGKASTYTNWGCRCTACREAHAVRMRDYYAAKGGR